MKPCVILTLSYMNYDRDEYLNTRKTLEDNNIQVKVASTRSGHAVAHHPDSSVVREQNPETARIDLTVDEIDPLSYQGMFLIGGPGALEYLDVHAVHEQLKAFYNFDLHYGAIGKACRILANASVLNNQQATGWNDDNRLPEILSARGCSYQNEQVVVSEKAITAKSYAAEQFGNTIAEHVSWY